MATLDELQQQLQELQAKVDALTAPPDEYYTLLYSGEEVDELLGTGGGTVKTVSGVAPGPDGNVALTAANVGAAPDGYGLGRYGKFISSSEDLNNVLANGWYAFSESPQNAPTLELDGWKCDYSYMFVSSRAANTATQIVFATNQSAVSGCMIKRYLIDANWSRWEWINPPLLFGVGYRTIERYNRKPVYVKMIDCGPAPAGGYKNTAHGIANIDKVVRCYGQAFASNNISISIPGMYGNAEKQRIDITANQSYITIYRFTDDPTGVYTCYGVIYYTSTTD